MEWRHPVMAWPNGQVEDQVRSLGPGKGRLHYQRWPDGREHIHHDRYDPAASAEEAALHLIVETPAVPIVLAMATTTTVAAAVVVVLWAVSRMRRSP